VAFLFLVVITMFTMPLIYIVIRVHYDLH
jgi:hypothetical protein